MIAISGSESRVQACSHLPIDAESRNPHVRGMVESDFVLKTNRVILGNCIEVLAQLPPASIDMVFADPPYNLQLQRDLYRPNQSRVDGVDDGWDRFEDFDAYDRFTTRLAGGGAPGAQAGRHLVGDRHLPQRLPGRAILQNLGFWVLNDIVWRKTNPMPNFRGRRFTNAHETLIWCARDRTQPLSLQLPGDEEPERRPADALRLAAAAVHRLRAAEGRRPQGARRPRSRKRCCTA